MRGRIASVSVLAATLGIPVAPAATAAVLEEVVVTARKRAESMQDVPMAVSAYSAEQLSSALIDDITDLEKMTPNTTLSETGGLVAGSLSAFIRGIGNDPGFDQGVGIYLDDVYLNSASGSLLEVYDLQRVEILKGPQGNLYGRNTIGGAIKYITRQPGPETQVDLAVKLGSHDQRQVEAGVSGSLVDDQLYGSVGVLTTRRDGIQDNVSSGKEYWDKRVDAYRGALRWTPAERHELRLMLDYSEDRSDPVLPQRIGVNSATLDGISFVVTGANTYLGGTGLVEAPNDTTLLRDEDDVNTELDAAFDDFRIKSSTASLTYLWDIDDAWTLKSVTAYREVDSDVAFDYDGTDQQFITTIRSRNDEDISQEFQLNYSTETLNAVFGLYYLDSDADNEPTSEQFARLRAVQEITADTVQDKRGLTSMSGYASVDWDFAPDWQLTLGGRYTQDEKSLDQLTLNREGYYALALLQGFPPNAIVAVRPGAEAVAEEQPMFAGWMTPFDRYMEIHSETEYHQEESWTEFTPTIRVSHHLNEDVLLYTGYSTGFKSGGFQTTGGRATGYDPETVDSYVIGAKTTAFGQRLIVNAEAFYNEYEGKQLSTIVVTDGALDQTVDNVGEMTTLGAEVEVTALLGADWQWQFNLGYLDTDVDEYSSTDDEGNAIDIADTTEIGFSPEWTAQTRLQKYFDLGSLGSVSAMVDAAYRDNAYVNSPIDLDSDFAAVQEQDSYVIWNAGVQWNSADERFRVSLKGKNLDDKRVLVNSYVVGPFVNGAYNLPRTWAVELAYRM